MSDHDPQPALTLGRLALNPNDRHDLNAIFRKAADPSRSERERHAAESLLVAFARSISAPVALYAQRLAVLLTWIKRHPEALASLVLPGERFGQPATEPQTSSADDYHLRLSTERYFADLEREDERRRLEQRVDHSTGCNSVFDNPGI